MAVRQARSQAVDAYVAQAPEEQRAALEHLRETIRRHLPHTEEQLGKHGFALYTLDGEWVAGFATRKKGPMLYLMLQEILDEHEPALGRLRSGRSCVEWKASRTLSLDELDALAQRMLEQAAQLRPAP